MTIWLTILLVLVLAAQLYRGTCALVSLPTISVAIFLVSVLPKILIYRTMGDEALLTSTGFGPADIAAGEVVIFAFLFTIQAVYLLMPRAFGSRALTAGSRQGRPYHRISRVRALTVLIFIPASLIFLAYFVTLKGSSILDLFSKSQLWDEFGTELSDLYFIQKIGFFVKIPFYMMLYKILSTDRMSMADIQIGVVATLLALMLFLFSGQRSGVLITIFELLLVLQAGGRMRARVLLSVTGVFILVNVAIMATRYYDVQDASTVNLLLRRYFFDIEKIAGIIGFASETNWAVTNPIYILTDQAREVTIDKPLHFFIAEIFGYGGGVPPTALGEILIHFGGWAVIPGTIVIAVTVRFLEQAVFQSRSVLYAMIYVLALSHFYYFGLNSDMTSFVRRWLADLAIVLGAVVVYSVYNVVTRKRLRRRRGGIRPPDLPLDPQRRPSGRPPVLPGSRHREAGS